MNKIALFMISVTLPSALLAATLKEQWSVEKTSLGCAAEKREANTKFRLQRFKNELALFQITVVSPKYQDSGVSIDGNQMLIRFDDNFRTDVHLIRVMKSSLLLIGSVDNEDNDRFRSLISRSSSMKIIFNGDNVQSFSLSGSSAMMEALQNCVDN